MKYFFDRNTIMIYGLVQFKISKWSLKFLKINLFGLWLVCAKILYTPANFLNGNDMVSQKWPKMNKNAWSDITEKQKLVYEQCLKFNRYMCWYKAFLEYRRCTYILESTEHTVYVLLYDKKWPFLTGMQLVYAIMVYV